MKVIEHLNNSTEPLFSYEIIPPQRGRSVQGILDTVEALIPLNPSWIDVTSYSARAFYNENIDGKIERKIIKKRPGTIGICGIIQNRFRIDTVAHILSLGFTKEETEDALIELNYLGVENVLALRGDGLNYNEKIDHGRSVNTFASDLVEQLKDMRKGCFLTKVHGAKPLDFGCGVAAYPEKHFESPNIKTDIMYLKKKIDAGADYVTSQMFYDNKKYYSFVKSCRESGIDVPIIPGLKVLKSIKQLHSFPKKFHIDFPDQLVNEALESPEHVVEIGINWAIKQTEELMSFGVPGVHFYIMNDTQSVVKVVKKFK
jgi:methylenetetrahydrofolate reductase (NADPH)